MKPTSKQLAYLRSLALATGTTFTYPTTSANASVEIRRLKTVGRSSRSDRTREQRAVQHDLAERPDDATAIRANDVIGYGSNCRWSH